MQNDKSDLLISLAELFCMHPTDISHELHPDFCRYFQHLFGAPDAVRRYIEEIRYLVRVGDIRGHVLDLAAGFGVSSICLLGFGAGKVTALDISETKVAVGRKLFTRFGQDIGILQGSACNLPFPNSSFDAVFIKDALSHIIDRDRLFIEVRRVLCSGGTLTIYDDRNARNAKVRQNTYEVWRRSEFGSPREIADLGMNKNFSTMRRRFISNLRPELDSEVLDKLAVETRGYTYRTLPQIIAARLNGYTDSSPPVTDCINPENEIAQEILIDPISLVRELEAHGFRARTHPPLDMDAVYWEGVGTWRGILRRHLYALVWPLQISRVCDFIVTATIPS